MTARKKRRKIKKSKLGHRFEIKEKQMKLKTFPSYQNHSFCDHSDPKKKEKKIKKIADHQKNLIFFIIVVFCFCLAILLFRGFFEQFLAKNTPDNATPPLLLLLYANVQSVFNAYQILKKKALPQLP